MSIFYITIYFSLIIPVLPTLGGFDEDPMRSCLGEHILKWAKQAIVVSVLVVMEAASFLPYLPFCFSKRKPYSCSRKSS